MGLPSFSSSGWPSEPWASSLQFSMQRFLRETTVQLCIEKDGSPGEQIEDHSQPGLAYLHPFRREFLSPLEASGSSGRSQGQVGKLAVAVTSSQVLWKPISRFSESRQVSNFY